MSNNLLDSPELQAIRMLDSDIRRYLYETCLPFEVGIHLLPLALLEIVDEKLREFKAKRSELVEVVRCRLSPPVPGGCRPAAHTRKAWSTIEGRDWTSPARLRLSGNCCVPFRVELYRAT